MNATTILRSLRACSPIWASLARTRQRGALSSAPRGFAARSRVLARLASLAQIGELARRQYFTLKMYIEWQNVDILLTLQVPSNHHE